MGEQGAGALPFASGEHTWVGAQGGASSARASREKARMAILEEADIVCSTLSFSGAGLFERMSRPFDVVVIDEAAQAVEPSTLVPMVLGCQQVTACTHAPTGDDHFISLSVSRTEPEPPCELTLAQHLR